MTTVNRVKEQILAETTANDWVDIALKWAIVAKKADGDQHSFEYVHNLSLEQLTYVNNKTRTYNTGGDLAVKNIEDLVKERLSKEKSVQSVYCFNNNGKHDFFIETSDNDTNTISKLSDIYWDLFDGLTDSASFEFKPLPSEYFREDELPEGSTRISRR